MTHRGSHAPLSAVAIVAVAMVLSPGCAISAMQPLPDNHTVEKAPSCTESSGSVGLDVVWGLLWGIPTIAAFGEEELGLGFLFALAAGVHVASAVTGVKWGSKCKNARKLHNEWLVDQRTQLKQQRRANRRLEPPPAATAPAPTPATDSPKPGEAPAPPPDPTTTPPASAKLVPVRLTLPRPASKPPTKPRRPRNSDPWAEFWQEVTR